MDRLFAQPASSQLLLASVVRAQEDVYRVRRRRRRLVSAMALASGICFVAARAGITWLRWSSLLFAVLAVSSIAAWYVERRVARRRDALVEQLPVEYRSMIGAVE